MPTALLSVSDKTNLVPFAQQLNTLGWSLVASGGTARQLREADLPVTDVAALTGSPEILGGRVKTLHPKIHGGILARPTSADQAELSDHDITPFDLVVCNLYPFQQTVAKPEVNLAEAIEKIDIGGVTLLRAAAKNFVRVAVVCNPADYQIVVNELRANGTVSDTTRTQLALKAFQHTATYDIAIANYLAGQATDQADPLPSPLLTGLVQTQRMRYGENPHQAAALYAAGPDVGPLGGTLLQGKPLSYNNMLDLDAAWQAAQAFGNPTVVIVKHLSPCGIATAKTLGQAFAPALASDPVSAFGGVIAVNRAFDGELADTLGDLFVEAIAAPSFTDAARDLLAKRKNCRLVEIPHAEDASVELRSLTGGVLVQTRDQGDPTSAMWRVVTDRHPTVEEMTALRFAWIACQHVKSNAIVLAQQTATVGIGGGLPSRVDATELAVKKAGEQAQRAVLASDAFFPFPDGIEVAADAGVTAVVQPGGSIRDKQVIETANRLELTMLFTDTRHFRH